MKLIEALTILGRAPEQAKPFRVFLACGFEPVHFQTFLAAHLQTLLPDRRVEVSTGLFGDMPGNLKLAAGFDGDAVSVVLEWPDFDPRLGIRSLGGWGPKQLQDILAVVPSQVARIQELLLDAAKRLPLAVSFPTLPLPPISPTPSWQASELDLALEEHVAKLTSWAARQANVRVASAGFLSTRSPVSDRLDVQSYVLSGFPYRVPFASVLAEASAQLIYNRAPKKGLVTDLDNTLWSGILGEVGIEGVSWDLDHHSQMHAVYQQALRALAQRGVMVGVATKNDSSLVQQALGNERLLVSKGNLFPVEAHWGPKSESIARILKAWNVGADSIVFIDDSPLDLAEVKTAHPEVECILFPRGNDKAIYALIENFRDIFGKSLIAEEDLLRGESQRSGAIFQEAAKSSTSQDAFLGQLGAVLKLNFQKLPADPRALELVNKTNQFNLNGRRQSEASWQTYLSSPDTFLLSASYDDKFGPLGKIAVIAGRWRHKTVFIDSWVMSCRAFSRRIEHQCLAQLFHKFGADEVVLDFAKTSRNGPLQEFVSTFSHPNGNPQLRIPEKVFAEKCPALFHQVQELTNG